MSQKAADDARPVPNATLDARGVPCPWPIVEANRFVKRMESGEILQLLTDCTAAVDEIPLWSKEASIELLCMQETARGGHEFYLRKA